ncbi:MAG: endospore germination permease [Bacillota bacterium]
MRSESGNEILGGVPAMLEEGRISAFQAMIYQISMMLATLILFTPGVAAMKARGDAWLSIFPALLLGFMAVFIATRLALRFPEQTVVEYTPRVLGAFFGKLIGFIYVFYFFFLMYYVQRQFGELMSTSYFPLTPNIVLIALLTLLAAYMVYMGLEVICRVALIWGVFVPAFFLLFALIAKDIEVGNFQPVLEHGIGPVVAGSFLPGATFTEAAVVVLILLPFIGDKRRALGAGLAAVTGVCVLFAVVLIGAIGMMGAETTGRLMFPGFTLYRRMHVEALPVLDRQDALYMAIWVGGMLLKLATFFHAGMLSLGQWLGFKSHRPLILPVGALVTALGIQAWGNVTELADFAAQGVPFFILFITIVLPVILLLAAVLRKMRDDPAAGGEKRASAPDKKA